MENRGRFILILVGAVIAFVIAGTVIYFGMFAGGNGDNTNASNGTTTQPQTVELEMWGVFDSSEVFSGIISSYTEDRPNLEIIYKKIPFSEYEDRLINALAEGEGPDLFYVRNNWLPKHKNKLLPLEITPREYVNIYWESTASDFIRDGTAYAIPAYVDNLALFYNRDILENNNIEEPPSTWTQFIEDVKTITRFSQNGDILLSGVAMGTTGESAGGNVDRAPDILATLMMQNGSDVIDGEERTVVFDDEASRNGRSFIPGVSAVNFYTSFADPTKETYAWNQSQMYSIDAFAQGEAAMMFSYAYNISLVQAKSPYLNFGIAPIPQIQGGFPVTLSNYWGWGISKQSPYTEQARNFLTHLAQQEQYIQYLQASGRPTAMKALAQQQSSNTRLSPFLDQAEFTSSFYNPDSQEVDKIFNNLIQQVLNKNLNPERAIKDAAQQIEILMQP